MGMYDTVKCKYPLPQHTEVQDHTFQTKDFDCVLDEYTITEDGKLVLHEKIWEVVPEEERPYYGTEKWSNPLYRLFGSLRTRYLGDRVIDYHGDLRFYTVSRNKLLTFKARFTHGELESLTLESVEDCPLGEV